MTRMLTITMVLLCIGMSSFAAFEEETVLLYLFDEETGDEATDLSEFENHGEIVDAEWTEDGKNGGGLVFDGASTLIEVQHHESLVPGERRVDNRGVVQTEFVPGRTPTDCKERFCC